MGHIDKVKITDNNTEIILFDFFKSFFNAQIKPPEH